MRRLNFDESLALLRSGDAERPLFVPHDRATAAAFDAVASHWAPLRRAWIDGRAGEPAASADRAEAMVARIGADAYRAEAARA
mgnify:CR=1 FL=1